MRTLMALWTFYKRLMIPSFFVSALLAILRMDLSAVVTGIGFSYVFITPLIHFMIYDAANENEYYFYYNFGLSKLMLWGNTVFTSLVIGLTLILI